MPIKGKLIGIKEIASYRCIGCGVCVKSCMNDVIRMKRGVAYVTYPEDCSACFACLEDCPREAIIISVVNESLKDNVMNLV